MSQTTDDDDFKLAWEADNYDTTTSDSDDENPGNGLGEEADQEEAGEEEDVETQDEETTEAEETEEADTEEATTDEEPADDTEDYKALWERSQKEVKTMAGRLRATESRLLKENEELAGQVPPAVVPPNEEDEFLAKFRTEYNDDVIKAIDIITARKATQLFEEKVASRLAPLEQTTKAAVARAHFAAIEAAHPDVYEISNSPEFDAWIESRPAHVKAAYEFVREQGSAEEAISMLDEFKSITAPRKPVGIPTKKTVPASAVKRSRGALPTAAKPSNDDFESAWGEAPD
jgi:hypothetical protein